MMKCGLLILSLTWVANSFPLRGRVSPTLAVSSGNSMATVKPLKQSAYISSTKLLVQNDDKEFEMNKSDQTLLGGVGVLASAIVLYSEYTLKSTGCGLPAGPAGLFGAAEGISYLIVVAVAAYSLLTKFKTGSGLPAGPGGILGAAEGLSFLAVAAGLVVLGFQLVDYGYIPNAVPMEGGMCS
jgi:hypothetical protein